MRRVISIFLLFSSLTFYSSAQNGRILDKKVFVFADTTISKLEESYPDVRSVIKSVEFYAITYLSDGLKVKGYMAQPKKESKYPCVIYNRGGNRDRAALEEGDGRIFRYLGVTASWGYVVVASQYRGNKGGEGKEEMGGSDVNDVLNMVPLLTNIDKADTSRIGMYGWSRGGMMTYLALTKTNGIKAAVIGSGMTDLLANMKIHPEMGEVYAQLIPGYEQNKDSVLKQRSVVFFANTIAKTTPLLIMHGSADLGIPADEVLNLVNKLYLLKIPFRFILFEGGQHSLIEHYNEVTENVKSFLNTYVRDRKPWPSIEPHAN